MIRTILMMLAVMSLEEVVVTIPTKELGYCGVK